MAVVAGLSCARRRCPSNRPSPPRFRTGWELRSVKFHKSCSMSSRQSSSHVLLKRLPSKCTSSILQGSTPNFEYPKRAEQSVDAKPSCYPEPQSAADEPGTTQTNASGKNAQSAFERAAAYKKLKNSWTLRTPPGPSPDAPSDRPRVEIIRGQEVELNWDLSLSSPLPNGGRSTVDKIGEGPAGVDSEDVTTRPSIPMKGKGEAVPIAALERENAYTTKQEVVVAALRGNAGDNTGATENVVEIEIVTRDGLVKRKLLNPEEQRRAFSNIKDVKRRGVSGIDFAGLGFADKKKSGRPAGLIENLVDPPTGPLPAVEILTRDAGRSETEDAERDQSSDLYKPRVSTWGIFPRPANISKTYGGGRTIRPGESLESEEENKEREAHTQQLLADYRKKLGLDIDPRIKAEAEQVMKQGDNLVDKGYLKEALQRYELVMKKIPVQAELYGLAALQTAVCLDSLSRYNEARQVYEKLLVHPNSRVSKQARRFLFGFQAHKYAPFLQAMDKMKVGGGHKWDTTLYQKYFDTFAANGYNTTYQAGEDEKASINLVPYVLLLLFPILLVFALARLKT